MREPIFVPVGQAGIRVFAGIAAIILEERGLDLEGRVGGQGLIQGVDLLLEREGEGKYRPRAVLVDPDSSAISDYTSFGLAALPAVAGAQGSGNNWAQGFYQHGPALREPVLEHIRRLAERCESVDNIHIVHSLGGGSGSGLGVYLRKRLKYGLYTKYLYILPIYEMHSATSLLPSPLCNDVAVEPYNALLALSQLFLPNFPDFQCLPYAYYATAIQSNYPHLSGFEPFNSTVLSNMIEDVREVGE